MALKPPLKWAGGKRWLADEFCSLFGDSLSLRWIEPFCGGLGLTLSILPERALLCDRNEHLINFYQWVKRGLKLPIDRFKNCRTTYYRLRNRFNELIKNGQKDSEEAAALFYYLNRTGYNGLCRFNSSGLFNVPFGKYKKIHYEESFVSLQEAFQGWEFMAGDFTVVTPYIGEDCLVYADPPYDVEFVNYDGNGFSFEDQVRLADWLASLPAALIVASNQATARMLKLYHERGFSVRVINGPRRISCTGDRTPAREMLAYKRKDR